MLTLSLLSGLLTLVGAGSSHPRYPNPLLSQCQVMSGIAEKLATGMSVYHGGGELNCSLVTLMADKSSPRSATDCTQISCQDSTGSINFKVSLMPCSAPPALRVAQNDSHGFVVNSTLSQSKTVAVDVDGPVFLFVGIGQHANKLSLGLQVISISTTKNVTIVPYTEIPLDKNNCPGSAPLISDTCRVMSNVTQYLNYFFSTVSHFEKAPECTFSVSCNDISCAFPDGGYYNLSILACHGPPSVKLVTSGEFSFEHTSSHSEIVPFPPVQDIISLNVTFKVIDHFTIGLALDFTNETASNQPIIVIPYVEMLPNKSMCTTDSYSHSPLVTACDLLPLLSQSYFNSLKKAKQLCSVKQNCTISECQLSSLGNATIELRLYGCFQPPAIEIFISDTAGHLSIRTRKISTSKSVQGMVNGRSLELDVTVVQRTDNALVGVEVMANHSGRIFPYHEIPVSCTKHTVSTKVTDTCEVMKDIAHYITVFLANVTNQPELTPECTVTKPSCHSIACSSTDGAHYNVNISPCSTPPTFQLEVQRSGSLTFRRTYSANNRVTEQFDGNTQLQVTVGYEVDLLVLELLVKYDDGVQTFTLPAIPYVRIPVNRSNDCTTKKPASLNQRPTTSGPYPNDNQYKRTLLAIEVGVPGGLIFCLIVVCFFCLVGRCIRHCVTRKTQNYQYSLLQVTSDLESDKSLEEGEYYV